MYAKRIRKRIACEREVHERGLMGNFWKQKTLDMLHERFVDHT